jgi:hypothetical protein
MDVQIITKDPIKRKITYRSVVKAEKTLLKDVETRSGPPLSTPSSRRSNLPPSSSDAGTKPLAAVPTLRAVADLKRGLTLEVEPSSAFG